MSAKSWVLGMGFLIPLCIGVAVILGMAPRAEATCWNDSGVNCRSRCGPGYNRILNQCLQQATTVDDSTLICGECTFPGYIYGDFKNGYPADQVACQ